MKWEEAEGFQVCTGGSKSFVSILEEEKLRGQIMLSKVKRVLSESDSYTTCENLGYLDKS